MRCAILMLVCVLSFITAAANPIDPNCPREATYKTPDMDGVMLIGRFSESFVGMGGAGEIGNAIHAMSWDGAVLGTQWILQCTYIYAQPVVVSADTSAGTGTVVYETTYMGGTFWLSKSGPWGFGNNDPQFPDFPGVVTSFVSTSTHEYENGSITAIYSSITMEGLFSNCDRCMVMSISDALLLGTTDQGPLPVDYPPFLDPNCLPHFEGAWGDVPSITMQIRGSCTTPVKTSTWGALKALYR